MSGGVRGAVGVSLYIVPCVWPYDCMGHLGVEEIHAHG